MSNEKITGKKLIMMVLKSGKKPLSVSDIWDIAVEKKYAKSYGQGTDAEQKKRQIGSDIYRWYQQENSPLERFEKGEKGNKDITYFLGEIVQPPYRKGVREEGNGKNDDRRKVSSAYCKPVLYSNWNDKLREVKTREGTDELSIVYRFYSVNNGRVKYVGRTDKPFSRSNYHYQQIFCNGMHGDLDCRIFKVDFKYFTGKNRFEEAYKEECRIYHNRKPEKNKNHPARNKCESWKCPKKYCEYST